jgi:hypothetical protein
MSLLSEKCDNPRTVRLVTSQTGLEMPPTVGMVGQARSSFRFCVYSELEARVGIEPTNNGLLTLSLLP